MMPMRILAASALAVAMLSGPGARAEEKAPSDADLVVKGRQLFNRLCSHCHGINMMSAGTLTYDLREFPRDRRERFFEAVTNGKSSRMPPWGDLITQDEIEEIWAFVRTGGK